MICCDLPRFAAICPLIFGSTYLSFNRETPYLNVLLIHRGLPLITYAPRGGGGVNTNAYKCVQGGRGGLSMTKNTHFVRRFIENTTIMWTGGGIEYWFTKTSISH